MSDTASIGMTVFKCASPAMAAPPSYAAAACAGARAPTPIPRKTAASSGAARRRIVTSRGSVGLLGQALIDQAQRRVHVVLVHDERRREPQRALPRTQEQ